MKKIVLVTALLSSGIVQARPNYHEAKKILNNAPENIKTLMNAAPKVYSFESRFDDQDSVAFTGQIFRQVLMGNLKSYMGSLKRGAYQGSERSAVGSFNTFFKYSSNAPTRGAGSINGLSSHRLGLKDELGNRMRVAEGSTLNSIQNPGKNLVSKIAGNDNALRNGKLLGWQSQMVRGIDLLTVDADRNGDNFVEPEDFIQAAFQVVAKNAATGKSFTVSNGSMPEQRVDAAYITEDGVDWNQMIDKVLHGAVSFSQAAGDYLSTDLGDGKGLYTDNTQPQKTNNYTTLEHYWDEGFGYFGAARDYAYYSDETTKNKLSIDTDKDGMISILKEKNIGVAAVNAGRIDYSSADKGSGTLDLSNNAIQAFSAGRQLITKAPADYMKYVEANATLAVAAWERTIAAVVIHYLNRTLEMMNNYGTENYLFINHAKFWSEMKGYALAFQFNPTSMMTIEQFNKIHQMMGDAPVLMTAPADQVEDYKQSLKDVKEVLRVSFEFTELDANAF